MAFDTGSAATGALSGAAAGTAIMPGIGTAVGAIGGGLLGGFFGGGEEAQMSEEEKQIRRMQLANLERLRGQAMTGGDTAADRMVEHNRAENAAHMVGLAKTMGGDVALANRLAADGITRGSAEAAYQGQQQRVQEQQFADQLYTSALGQGRAPDANYTATVNAMNAAEAERRRQLQGQMLNNGAQIVGGFF